MTRNMHPSAVLVCVLIISVAVIVLVVAVLMIVVSAICWALGASHGNHSLASKGRVGVLVGAGAAVLAGAGVAWVNWLIALGQQL